MLAHQLDRLAQKDRWSRDFTLNSLRHALREVIACFPVYRSYITDEGVHDAGPHATSSVPCAGRRRRNPAHEPVAVPLHPRHAAARATPSRPTEEDRAEQRRLRRQVPAGDRPGHGQGRRGHGLLRLQPAAVAERGRRRPGPVRRAAGRAPPLQPGAAGAAGRCALSATLDPRHQAQRGRPRPAQRAVRDAATSGASAWRAGAG